MSEDAAPPVDRGAERPEPPVFNPDPELIDHLEGSRWWRRRYQEAAKKHRAEAEAAEAPR